MNNEESDIENRRNVYLPNKRNVRFFEITGKSLVYPMVYQLYNFQKEIILTTLNHNTLIGLSSGLGKNLISAIITYNFHRWLLNGKIVVLSQTRSYLTDQIRAYGLYTALQEKSFAELSANASEKDYESVCGKSIILTSPSKFLSCLNKNIFPLQNLVLLIVFENNKILKCVEYNEIKSRTTNFPFRTIVFIDPAGFNSKIIKQTVEQFNISKIEIRNMYSSEIKKCAYIAEIEPVEVEISPHIVNIKDAFYSVFEKYGKKIKDAKVITGNVASITKAQIQKAKEKFLKTPPHNMSKADRDDLVDSMIMCSFLCQGIELLHNWGVRAFYNYLFDNKKDDELKVLIVQDENLTSQMKLLNEYLRTNGMKFDSAVARLLHPKLLHLKNLLTRYFSTAKNVDSLRIIVTCSIEDVIDDIDRLFRNFLPSVRYNCIKTKAKRLSDEVEHQEVIQNLQAGVINVLVVSSLIEEIFEIKTTYVISLDPNKSLLKLSDARFQETTKKCIFILTKGIEYMKFETMLNEKKNEQKPLDTNGIELIAHKSSSLFPQDFDPEFECTSVKEAKSSLKNSPRQKTLFSYLQTSPNSSLESRNCRRKNVNQKRFCDTDSPSIFADTLNFSSSIDELSVQNANDAADFSFEDPVPYLSPFVNKHLSNSTAKNNDYDSFDELILDFPDNLYDSKTNINTPQKISSSRSWLRKSGRNSSCGANVIQESKSKSKEVNISLAELPNESFVDDLFDDSSNSEIMDDGERAFDGGVPCADSGSKMMETNVKKVNQNRPAFVDALFEDSSDSEKKDDKQSKLPEPDIGSVEAKVPDQHDQVGPMLNAENEFDSDCELFPPSPEAIPKNRLKISSAPWESLQNRVIINHLEIKEEKNDRPCNTFENVFIDETNGSISSSMPDKGSVTSLRNPKSPGNSCQMFEKRVEKPVSTTCDNSGQENEDCQTRLFNHSEIPSAIFNDSALESLTSEKCDLHSDEKTIMQPKASSPVLFSSRKPNRRRSLMSTGPDQSTSIKFDSFFDISKENLRRTDLVSSINGTRTASERLATGYSAVLEDDEDVFVNNTSKPTNSISKIEATSTPKNSPSVQSSHSITFPDDDFILDSVENARNAAPVNCSTPKATETKTSALVRLNDKLISKENRELKETSTPVSGNRSRFMQRARGSTPLFTVSDLDIQLLSPEVSPERPHHSREDAESKPTPKTNTPVRLNDKLTSEENQKSKIASIPVSGNRSRFMQCTRRSIPLFTESDSDIRLLSPEVSPERFHHSRKVEETESSPTVLLKQHLFSSFKENVQRNLSAIKGISKSNVLEKKSWTELDFDDDDEHFWLSKSSAVANNVNNCFKMPSPVLKNRPTVQRRSPASACERTPPNHKKKKRVMKKRNLVEAFIDREAEVSDDTDDDCSSIEDCSKSCNDSFIDDENITESTNISNYLKSLKSPKNAIGRFHIPVLSRSRLKVNVCSQVDDHEQSYEQDSFCVDEDESEPGSAYVASALTQLEERLSKRKGKCKPKLKQFKRIKVMEDSSPESPVKKKPERRRIQYFSSDSDD